MNLINRSMNIIKMFMNIIISLVNIHEPHSQCKISQWEWKLGTTLQQ